VPRSAFSTGSGPGVITPDGCAVDLYASLPAGDAILACCARHVAAVGCVVIERHPESWFDDAKEIEAVRDGIIFRLRDVSRPAAELLAATVEYRVGDKEWAQSFLTRRLDDARLRDRLRDARLRLDSALTDDGGWVLARPA